MDSNSRSRTSSLPISAAISIIRPRTRVNTPFLPPEHIDLHMTRICEHIPGFPRGSQCTTNWGWGGAEGLVRGSRKSNFTDREAHMENTAPARDGLTCLKANLPCDFLGGETYYRARPAKPILEASESDIGLLCASFLLKTTEHEPTGGGGEHIRSGGGFQNRFWGGVLWYVFPSPEFTTPLINNYRQHFLW